MAKGPELVEMVKAHVLETMRSMDECAAGTGKGAGNRAIEQEADLSLDLPGQDGWFTRSALMSLERDGLVEVVPGTEKRRRFRLV